MSDNLARDKLFATLAMLSGDPVLAPYGELQEKLASTRTHKSSIGNGFILDSASGQVVRDPAYAEYERGRDELEQKRRQQLQQDMLARLGTSADLRAQQPKYTEKDTDSGIVPVQINPRAPGGASAGAVIPIQHALANADKQKAAEAERLALQARQLFGDLSKTQGVVSSPKDIVTETLSKVPVVGRGAARAAQERLYTPDQLQVKTRGARFEQNLSNLAAGLALTGYEIEQRDRWSPFATGISQQESQRRLENIERDFGQRRDSILHANDMTIYPRGSAEDKTAGAQAEKTLPTEEWVIGKDGKPVRIH